MQHIFPICYILFFIRAESHLTFTNTSHNHEASTPPLTNRSRSHAKLLLEMSTHFAILQNPFVTLQFATTTPKNSPERQHPAENKSPNYQRI